MTIALFLATTALLTIAPPEQAQAQLYLDIFPSRDDTNATLWVFSGSSTGWAHNNAGPHIRTNGGFDDQDTDKTTSALLQDPASLTPAANYNLTPLFTATTTNAPNDLETLDYWKGRTINWGTTNTNDDITIPSTATNVPTLSYAGVGSRTIAAMHLDNVANTGWDDIGPRTSSQLTYGSSPRAVTWSGAGIMTNKPIAHFHLTTPGSHIGNRAANAGAILGSWSNWRVDQGLRIRVHSTIPEPEEYALVFGLFALGFVILRRATSKRNNGKPQQPVSSRRALEASEMPWSIGFLTSLSFSRKRSFFVS